MAKQKASKAKKHARTQVASVLGIQVNTLIGIAIVIAGASLLASAAAFFSLKRVCKYPDGSYGRSCTSDYQCRISKPLMRGQCVYAPVSTRATQPLSKPVIIPKIVPTPIPKPTPLPIPPRPSIKR